MLKGTLNFSITFVHIFLSDNQLIVSKIGATARWSVITGFINVLMIYFHYLQLPGEEKKQCTKKENVTKSLNI